MGVTVVSDFCFGPVLRVTNSYFHCIIGASSRQCQWSYLGPMKYFLKAYPSDHLKAFASYTMISCCHTEFDQNDQIEHSRPCLNCCTKNIYRCDVRNLPPTRLYRKIWSCAWLPFWIKHTWKLNISWLSCWQTLQLILSDISLLIILQWELISIPEMLLPIPRQAVDYLCHCRSTKFSPELAFGHKI